MPICESCNLEAKWQNPDKSFACHSHKEWLAVYIGEQRRHRLARWAKELSNIGTVKLMPRTYLHRALMATNAGLHRFTDLRDNDQNAGSLQKALILGFIEKEADGDYRLTGNGLHALCILNKAPAAKFAKVPYIKSQTWAKHAQTFCW